MYQHPSTDPVPEEAAPRATRRRRLVRGAAPWVAVSAVALGAGVTLQRDVLGDDAPAAAPAAAARATQPVSATTAAKTPAVIYREARPGVVTITARGGSTGSGIPGGGSQQVAQGTGFVIDEKGSILTNEHVVSGASGLRITFATGRTVDGTVVGTDPSSDLAVVDVDVPASQLHPLTIGSSADIEPGDPVVAIGNPFGYDGTITAGIVSGLDRSIQAPNGFTISGAVQTDAPINHGNSGGPLLDAEGKVVGVAAQIADSGVNANVGVGFAIPSDTARRVADDLRANGKVRHAWLGISGHSVDTQVSPSTSGPSSGVVVNGVVTGGPAADAGLRTGAAQPGTAACADGDVITRIDDVAVSGMEDLQAVIAEKAPGDEVTLGVTRANGDTTTVTVTLGTQPANAGAAASTCNG